MVIEAAKAGTVSSSDAAAALTTDFKRAIIFIVFCSSLLNMLILLDFIHFNQSQAPDFLHLPLREDILLHIHTTIIRGLGQ